MGKFLWEDKKKGLTCRLSQFSFASSTQQWCASLKKPKILIFFKISIQKKVSKLTKNIFENSSNLKIVIKLHTNIAICISHTPMMEWRWCVSQRAENTDFVHNIFSKMGPYKLTKKGSENSSNWKIVLYIFALESIKHLLWLKSEKLPSEIVIMSVINPTGGFCHSYLWCGCSTCCIQPGGFLNDRLLYKIYHSEMFLLTWLRHFKRTRIKLCDSRHLVVTCLLKLLSHVMLHMKILQLISRVYRSLWYLISISGWVSRTAACRNGSSPVHEPFRTKLPSLFFV